MTRVLLLHKLGLHDDDDRVHLLIQELSLHDDILLEEVVLELVEGDHLCSLHVLVLISICGLKGQVSD